MLNITLILQVAQLLKQLQDEYSECDINDYHAYDHTITLTVRNPSFNTLSLQFAYDLTPDESYITIRNERLNKVRAQAFGENSFNFAKEMFEEIG